MVQERLSPFTQARTRVDATAPLPEVLKLTPCGRMGEPADIANTILFLASDVSDPMTGATIHIDGSVALRPFVSTAEDS